MTRIQQILAGVLALQIILAGIVFWPRSNVGAAGEPLLADFAADEVIALSIESENGDLIRLSRTDSGWEMTDSGYPALSANITEFLDKLTLVESGRLVTQTSSSHRRLQVAEDDFQRLVKLTLADNSSRTLIFGTAPTAQSVHVRVPNQDETWISGALALRDIDPASRNWVEPVYYTLDQDTIGGIVIENQNGRFELVKLGSGEATTWSYTELQDGELFNEAGLTTLLGRIASVRFNEPLSQAEQPSYNLGNPAAVVTVQTTSGAEQLVIGQAAEGEDPVVKWSGSPYYVTMSSFNTDVFINAARDTFVVAGEQ